MLKAIGVTWYMNCLLKTVNNQRFVKLLRSVQQGHLLVVSVLVGLA